MDILSVPGGIVWSAMSSTLGEFAGIIDYRTKVDLAAILSGVSHQFISGIADDPASSAAGMVLPQTHWNAAHRVTGSQARLVATVKVPGSTANLAALRAQYSADASSSSWAYLDGSSGPTVSIYTTGTTAGSWVTLSTAVIADVFFRLVGINGNSSVSPEFGCIQLQVR